MTPPATPPAGSPHAGWGPPPRGVFVDVVGTLLAADADGEDHFPSFGSAEFYPGVLDGLFRVTQAGWNLYLIGNVRSVAFGEQSASDWKEFQEGLHGHLRSQGIKLTRDYTCPTHPEGIEGQNADSVYLLPGTGAMHHAAQADGIALPLSWVIGDQTTELVAGWRAGCRIAGVRTGQGMKGGSYHVDPELITDEASEALKLISRDMTMLRRVA